MDKKVRGGGVNFTFSMITYPNHGKLGHRHADACGSLGTFTSLHYDTLGIILKGYQCSMANIIYYINPQPPVPTGKNKSRQ